MVAENHAEPPWIADAVLWHSLSLQKSAQFLGTSGYGVGCDAYGTVVQLGPNLNTQLKIGDNVAFFEMGSYHSADKGTFSQYATTQSDTSIVVPENFDQYQASSFGIGGLTAVQCVFEKLGIKNLSKDLQGPPALSTDSPKLLVWAASTSVGQFAVQFARLAGYHVIATASPANHSYLKELGAVDLYDYKDSSTPEKISAKYPDLALAVDCFSEKGSSVATGNSLGKSVKGAKVVNILPTEKAAKEARPDVEFITTLVYTFLGREFTFGKWPKHHESELKQDNAFVKPWTAGNDSILHNLMLKGLVRGNKIKKMDGGLEQIEGGMKLQQEGKVSMEKLAYDVA